MTSWTMYNNILKDQYKKVVDFLLIEFRGPILSPYTSNNSPSLTPQRYLQSIHKLNQEHAIDLIACRLTGKLE